MDLLGLLSAIGSVASLDSWIKSCCNSTSGALDSVAIKKGPEKFCATIGDEYLRGKLDLLFSKCTDKIRVLDLFSAEERVKYIQDFLQTNQDLIYMQKDVSRLINQYFDTLSERLRKIITPGELILSQKIDTYHEAVEHKLDDVLEQVQKINDMTQSPCSASIITSLNLINQSLKHNCEHSLWADTEITDHDFLNASSLRDVFMRARDLFCKFDSAYFTFGNAETPIDALIMWALNHASDLGNELNEYYRTKAKPAIDCIYNYEKENEKYYIALGALGLYSNHDDISIFKCVMTTLAQLLDRCATFLQNLWASSKEKEIELSVTKDLQERSLNKLKYMVNNEALKYIKVLVDNGKMLDTDLAIQSGVTVESLRHTLYPLRKTIICYSYYNNLSTKVWVPPHYLKTFQTYYNDIFGVLEHED